MAETQVRKRRPIHEPGRIHSEHGELDETDGEFEVRSYRTGFGTLCKIAVLLVILVPVMYVLYAILFVEAPIDPQFLRLKEPGPLTGPLERNTLLQKAEKMFENQIRGPESIVVKNGAIYTGTADGKIVEIKGDKMRTLATLGSPPCGAEEQEPTCGRPLGIRFNKEGSLVVLDGYLGLYKIDPKSGKSTQLLSSETSFSSRNFTRPKLLNDLDITSDGIIYFTDSSMKWERRYNRYCILEAIDDGRLFRYDPKEDKLELIMTKLRFANGVQLSPDESFLLVVETTSCRIYKYHLKGPKANQFETFADNLPGMPDNIRASSSGGYWVGMATVRKPPFSPIDIMAPRPWIRKLLTQLFPQNWLIKFVKQYGMVIELDQAGKVVQSLQDPEAAHIPAVSEVEDDGQHLYLGSYAEPYLAKLKVADL